MRSRVEESLYAEPGRREACLVRRRAWYGGVPGTEATLVRRLPWYGGYPGVYVPYLPGYMHPCTTLGIPPYPYHTLVYTSVMLVCPLAREEALGSNP